LDSYSNKEVRQLWVHNASTNHLSREPEEVSGRGSWTFPWWGHSSCCRLRPLFWREKNDNFDQ
jgi:hypothetical protein